MPRVPATALIPSARAGYEAKLNANKTMAIRFTTRCLPRCARTCRVAGANRSACLPTAKCDFYDGRHGARDGVRTRDPQLGKIAGIRGRPLVYILATGRERHRGPQTVPLRHPLWAGGPPPGPTGVGTPPPGSAEKQQGACARCCAPWTRPSTARPGQAAAQLAGGLSADGGRSRRVAVRAAGRPRPETRFPRRAAANSRDTVTTNSSHWRPGHPPSRSPDSSRRRR